jgi:3-hydroxyisobutyrate dehydrogenase-like beta-hydroxyacid dehydrogenase
MRIGFIGTGSMGSAVALNLIEAGHHLQVRDTRPEATEELAAAGAVVCGTPAEAAAGADVVMLSLPSHVEVESVVLGADGVLSTASPGTYLIDLTTISVSLVPRLLDTERTHGLHYLAAPVSQGVDNARLGRLSLFVGGAAADLAACRPIFDAIGTVHIHTGDQESAVAAKLLTNLLWYINAAAIGEALVMGAKSGITLPVLREVILNSCGTSWVADHDIPQIYDGSFDPTFTTKLCTKDLRLITELAARQGLPLAMGSAADEVFRRSEATYGPESPELSVVRHLQEVTGTRLQTEQARR